MTKGEPQTRWREAHIGFENDGFRLKGIDVWNASWREVKTEAVILPHPAHPQQRHSYWLYDIGDFESPVRFAVGELSNGVWGFYVPETQ